MFFSILGLKMKYIRYINNFENKNNNQFTTSLFFIHKVSLAFFSIIHQLIIQFCLNSLLVFTFI